MLLRSIKRSTKSEKHTQAPSLPKACPGQKSAHKWQGQLLPTLWGRWLSSHVKDILGRKRRMLKMVIMGNWSFSIFFNPRFYILKNPFRTYTYLSSWSLAFTSSGWSDGFLSLFSISDKIKAKAEREPIHASLNICCVYPSFCRVQVWVFQPVPVWYNLCSTGYFYYCATFCWHATFLIKRLICNLRPHQLHEFALLYAHLHVLWTSSHIAGLFPFSTKVHLRFKPSHTMQCTPVSDKMLCLY